MSDAPADLIAALSNDCLRRASSAAIFQRGKTYAAGNAVNVMTEEGGPVPALYAQVTGTEVYDTEVWVDDGEVGGACDCPNAADGWFCKHQVAVALVWRDRLAGQPTASDPAASKQVQATVKRAQTIKDKRQALHDFLHGQSVTALAARLLALADDDSAIERALHQWRKLAEAPQETPQLKPLITEILAPGRGFIDWRESSHYAHRAAAVLPLLAQARANDPPGSVALILHALRRGWAVLQQADDSNGSIGELCADIGAQWVAALQATGPHPRAFGDTYLQVLLDDPISSFDTEAAEAALGDVALTRLRQVIAERWRQAKDAALARKALHKTQRKSTGHDDNIADSAHLWSLEAMHLRQLEAAGDIDGALAVMRTDLSEIGAYSRVTAYLERHGRYREAFANAEAGCKAAPDDWRQQDDLLRCYERDGWTAEALQLRRRRFDQRPGVDTYQALLEAARADGQDVPALRQALFTALVAREDAALAQPIPKLAWQSAAPTEPRRRDVSLRAQVLCSEHHWDEACALVQPPHVCDEGVLQAIAHRLGPHQQATAAALLMRVLRNALQHAKSPYRRELQLVDEVLTRLDPPGRTAWLAELRSTHKAKRNFVRDLPAS